VCCRMPPNLYLYSLIRQSTHNRIQFSETPTRHCQERTLMNGRVTVVLFALGLVVSAPSESAVGEEIVNDIIKVVNPKTLPAHLPAQRIPLGVDYKPSIARHPSGELLVVAFRGERLESGKIREDEILYRSGDGGKTWSGAEKLDLLGREPYLTVVKDGTIFITSNLLAQDARNKDGHAYSYLHRSRDGGRT